jgi:hypothetical protein
MLVPTSSLDLKTMKRMGKKSKALQAPTREDQGMMVEMEKHDCSTFDLFPSDLEN